MKHVIPAMCTRHLEHATGHNIKYIRTVLNVRIAKCDFKKLQQKIVRQEHNNHVYAQQSPIHHIC